MSSRIVRLAVSIALVTTLALPAVTSAAKPADTVAWQAHLAEMQAMPGTFGAHVQDCIAMHGSMAGLLGPNGEMVNGSHG